MSVLYRKQFAEIRLILKTQAPQSWLNVPRLNECSTDVKSNAWPPTCAARHRRDNVVALTRDA